MVRETQTLIPESTPVKVITDVSELTQILEQDPNTVVLLYTDDQPADHVQDLLNGKLRVPNSGIPVVVYYSTPSNARSGVDLYEQLSAEMLGRSLDDIMLIDSLTMFEVKPMRGAVAYDRKVKLPRAERVPHLKRAGFNRYPK